MKKRLIYSLMFVVCSCQSADLDHRANDQLAQEQEASISPYFTYTESQWREFVETRELSAEEKAKLNTNAYHFLELANAMLHANADLLLLVDKSHFLDATYAPADLISLDGLSWVTVNRKGHMLQKEALDALYAMTKAAKRDNITLVVSSTYRSYQRQEEVYKGWVRQLGQKQADRISAKAGTSQHQLGTVIDFGSIDAGFTGTAMQQWLAKHASYYGYSLSYPQGYEAETGYDYESWHYRYIGKEASMMQREFFNDLQYRLLTFWVDNVAYLKKHWIE